MHCGGGSFKTQMRRADASGARHAVIIGDDEVQAGAVTVKPLRDSSQQVRLALDDALGFLKKTRDINGIRS